MENRIGNNSPGSMFRSGASGLSINKPPDSSLSHTGEENNKSTMTNVPLISLPKGGGAIRGIGEKFSVNAATGTGSVNVPIFTSPGRSGFGPHLSLSYDSGSGNGPFGLGWSLSIPSISRKTDKGLPLYKDEEESDTFILSGAEDLVPVLTKENGKWIRKSSPRPVEEPQFYVQRYRPRIEGLFARIERWTNIESGEIHWRSISKDNVTTLYGKSENSRIADPDNKLRIFSWLICESFDDKGNAMRYEYKKENSEDINSNSHIHEKNRTDKTRSVQRYIKRIKYGNKTPREPGEDLSLHHDEDWMFEVVFDYGEHYVENNGQPSFVSISGNGIQWGVRNDPLSVYRSTFEIRTYRLCRRVLMFHHFPKELGVQDYLVRSTEFTYDERSNLPVASFLTAVTQSGFVLRKEGNYYKKSLPPLEFEYSQFDYGEDKLKREIYEIDTVSLENLPYGLDGSHYQWVDLDGEGLSGILTEQGDAWFYKHNQSTVPINGSEGKPITVARFAAQEVVNVIPADSEITNRRNQLIDLAGDGQLDLVRFEGSQGGYFERTVDDRWKSYVPFDYNPNIRWNDPNLRFVDLTGDGHADILITEQDVFMWYPSMSEEGFSEGRRVLQAFDEEKGPRVLFGDGTQSIYLADMSGDGLSDLVRIRNGEVCYWPNLGYGKFGAKVTMDNSPIFDVSDQFDNARIRLADSDGSGTTDIIYLAEDGVKLYFNESGNSWSNARIITDFPIADNLSSVTALDLLGNGTACLLWSSPNPGEGRYYMRYIDLMEGLKPHLMVLIRNNMGSETKLQYAPSTKFYLQDKLEGEPWVTRLPFPVHVVERVDTYDWISRNLFVTKYIYHDGFFDGDEREFRGFGHVEQLDTEEFAVLSKNEAFPEVPKTNIEEYSHVPPVVTKTWYHTGAYFEEGTVSRHYKGEYYREPDLSDQESEDRLLPDTVMPVPPPQEDTLSPEEERDAHRALKGSILRQEVYSLDGVPPNMQLSQVSKFKTPYTVSEYNYGIELIQRQEINRNCVFFVHPQETVDYHFEQKPFDPRISHNIILDVDKFGNILTSVSIGYGRQNPDPELSSEEQMKQKHPLCTCVDNLFTNYIDEDDEYRTPLPYESSTYEITGLIPDINSNAEAKKRIDFDTILNTIDSAEILQYEKKPLGHPKIQKRLIEQVRSIYTKNDLSGPAAPRVLQSLSLPYESYKLALTPGLITDIYGDRVSNEMLSDKKEGGGYVHFPPEDPNWWVPSGIVYYHLDPLDPNRVEFAKEHFYLPHRFEDPFENFTTIRYDHYSLLLKETHDPVDNVVTVVTKDDEGNDVNAIDYRVLQPWTVTDPNGNRVAAAFDALGSVSFTAIMGKLEEPDGIPKGDILPKDLNIDLSSDEIDAFFSDPNGLAPILLGTATTRFIYDLDSYYRSKNSSMPAYSAIVTRDTHVNDPNIVNNDGAILQPPVFRTSFFYSDGFGREIQKKIPAEPEQGFLDPRWVGSGWAVFNNKGRPVRKYEPFFAGKEVGHRFEFGNKVGVSPSLFYDPLERVVATLHPNNTYEKVVFSPWEQKIYDVNDTVISDPKIDEDISGYISKYIDGDNFKTWYEDRISGPYETEQVAAQKTSEHADTPTSAYFDTLGRTFLTISDNGKSGKYKTQLELDIEGNQRALKDAMGRTVIVYYYDILGNRIMQAGMDAVRPAGNVNSPIGVHWLLNDALGKPIYNWDSRGHIIHRFYNDRLHRPTEVLLQTIGEASKIVERVIYGESKGSELNHRGKVYEHYDGAGVVVNQMYDFKGNLVNSSRKFAVDYKNTVDWAGIVQLEEESFPMTMKFNAQNQRIIQTGPDNSIVHFIYNEANLLERIETRISRDATFRPIVKQINYDAKGQRKFIKYGNDIQTTYEYDGLTFRLKHLLTEREEEILQNLFYTYDPIGNIMFIQDKADIQKVVFSHGQRVEANAGYTYYPVYWLKEAQGREFMGSDGAAIHPPEPSGPDDDSRVNITDPNSALGTYIEKYDYDQVGNISVVDHSGADPSNPGWKRCYFYEQKSILDPNLTNNCLTRTVVGNDCATGETSLYSHDTHGNLINMPHLSLMKWNYQDQLHLTSKQKVDATKIPISTYYVYDASGKRVRKVTEGEADIGQIPRRLEERLYLPSFEVYRRFNGDGETIKLERESLHLLDNTHRVAIVETRTTGDDGSPTQGIRYQLSNHLSSSVLELDQDGHVISYEEYYPFGSTSYHAGRNTTEVKLKRYRYTAKERDVESGMYYYGARYYASWLGRWIRTDQAGLTDGPNLYAFVLNNPVNFKDPTGMQTEEERRHAGRAQAGSLRVFGQSTPPPPQPPAEGEQPKVEPVVGDFAKKVKVLFENPQTEHNLKVKYEVEFKASLVHGGGLKADPAVKASYEGSVKFPNTRFLDKPIIDRRLAGDESLGIDLKLDQEGAQVYWEAGVEGLSPPVPFGEGGAKYNLLTGEFKFNLGPIRVGVEGEVSPGIELSLGGKQALEGKPFDVTLEVGSGAIVAEVNKEHFKSPHDERTRAAEIMARTGSHRVAPRSFNWPTPEPRPNPEPEPEGYGTRVPEPKKVEQNRVEYGKDPNPVFSPYSFRSGVSPTYNYTTPLQLF